MALSVHQALMAPFSYNWAVREDLDERPFGSATSMLAMGATYIASLTLLKMAVGKEGIKGTRLKSLLKSLEQVNNFFMAIYSLYTFVGVAALLRHNYAEMSFDPVAPFCDSGRRLLKGMDFWFYTFYLSKFWEWIDTWVLILKGKEVWPPKNSQYFLHVFHHTTTASIAWLAWRQEFTIAWIGPLTNSFVHTPMYAYYFLTTIAPAVRQFGVYITPIQIFQFIMCLLSLVPEAVGMLTGFPTTCNSGSKRAVGWMIFTYSIFLCLFVKMFADKKAALRKKREDKVKKVG